MTDDYKEEINLEDMSSEEIEKYINSQSSSNDSDSEEQIQTSDEDKADGNIQEDNEVSPNPVDSSNEDKKDPFHGKTAEELREIIRNQNRMISQQGLEVGEARKELKRLSEIKSKDLKEELADYNENDISIISKIAEQTVRDLEIRKAAQFQEVRNSYFEENKRVFEYYKDDDAFKSLIEPVLNDEIALNPNVIYEPGWMQTQVFSILKQKALNSNSVAKHVDISEKKKSASSVGVSGSASSKRNKPVDTMTAEEYREYAGL